MHYIHLDEPDTRRRGTTMTTGGVNPRRADTRRNHELILAAALEALTTSGEISFKAIAKKGGVP